MQASNDTARPLHQETLLTRPVWWFLLFSLIANASLSLLFAALPLFAEETTGLGLAAGLVTGAMMLATVLVELATPRLMVTLGYRRSMEIGVALMGLPALVLIAFPNLATILAVAAARGAGLAITIVAGTALAAQLFPPHRRAEGLGIYGVAVSIPAIALLPLGLWLAGRYGFDLVFAGAAGLVMAGLAIGRRLPTVHPGAKPTHGIAAEHMPLRASSLPVGENMMLYRSLDYGNLLSIQILDTRQYRTDHPAGDGSFPRSPASTDPATSILGTSQERWLLQNLERSETRWNVLAQQVTMAETYFPSADGGPIEFYNDSWSGYPAARQRILDQFVNAQVSNPIVLTGDIHSSWAADLLADFLDPDSPVVGSEYVCTSITAGGTEADTWGQAYKDAFDYIKLYDGQHGGFTTIDITSDLWKADYFVVDNMEDPESGVSHLTTLVTESGNPGVEQS